MLLHFVQKLPLAAGCLCKLKVDGRLVGLQGWDEGGGLVHLSEIINTHINNLQPLSTHVLALWSGKTVWPDFKQMTSGCTKSFKNNLSSAVALETLLLLPYIFYYNFLKI